MTISLPNARKAGPKPVTPAKAAIAAAKPAQDAPVPQAAEAAPTPAVAPDSPVAEAATRAGDLPALLTPRDAGARLGVSAKVLERWRGTGGGPKFIKMSLKTIRYRPSDLDDFVAACTATSTAAAGK